MQWAKSQEDRTPATRYHRPKVAVLAKVTNLEVLAPSIATTVTWPVTTFTSIALKEQLTIGTNPLNYGRITN
jgi:hypothetical protein